VVAHLLKRSELSCLLGRTFVLGAKICIVREGFQLLGEFFLCWAQYFSKGVEISLFGGEFYDQNRHYLLLADFYTNWARSLVLGCVITVVLVHIRLLHEDHSTSLLGGRDPSFGNSLAVCGNNIFLLQEKLALEEVDLLFVAV
jgi:hypothetical protein